LRYIMNEFHFIERLRQQGSSRKHSPRVITGIGDDASVIRQLATRDLIVTADLLVEGVDFYANATPARLLGHKALAVSLSDIAAMGARPCWAFLSFGLPRERWETNFKDEFMAGYLALADHFGVTLSGGDVSQSPNGIVIDSIVLGEVESGAAVNRTGANVGDQIYVSGNLGGAAAGLKLIELGARVIQESGVRRQESEPPALAGGPVAAPAAVANKSTDSYERSDDDAIQSLLVRQLRPQPRVGWGIVLGEQCLATSMIDISDGLSSDLHHLCQESHVGALLEAAAIPLDEDVKRLCGRRALDPLGLALHGGEDFELLFTVAPENVSRLPKKVDDVPISRIGEVTNPGSSIRLSERGREWDLPPQGFQHFSD
jgi:thiamine-monophosphate kinase